MKEKEDSERSREGASYDYAKEKLWQAIGCLIGDGNLAERLGNSHTFIVRLAPVHFPDNLLPDFLAVKELTARATSREQGLPNAASLSSEEMVETANMILSLYVRLKGGIC